MTPYYEQSGITIYHGDCREVLPTVPSFDHVITDPPYSEHVHGKSRRGDDLDDKISRVKEFGFGSITSEVMAAAAGSFARAKRWVLVFSDIELTHEWRAALTANGLEYVRTGIYLKRNSTPQFSGDRPASACEAITIAHPKGRKRWHGGGTHGVWEATVDVNRGNRPTSFHPTQKPDSLMRDLVALFTDPDDLIVDAFMGSGTTLKAAKQLGRRAIGIELEEKYCEAAATRLQQESLFGAGVGENPSDRDAVDPSAQLPGMR